MSKVFWSDFIDRRFVVSYWLRRFDVFVINIFFVLVYNGYAGSDVFFFVGVYVYYFII